MMRTNDGRPALPPSCIRGPELYDAAQIAAELGAADDAALAAYADGVALLRQAHTLLAAEMRLAEARRTRAFLITQLVSLEARDTALFDTALSSYRGRACREEPPWHVPLAPTTRD
jgi:hypothetical protein